MKLSDKLTKWELFKNSSKFGNDTYLTLVVYGRNLYSVINTINVYLLLLNSLEKNILKLQYDQKDLLSVKQHITLDILFHIMIIIETTVVLCHALSKGYSKVSTIMTFYDYNLVNTVFKNIQDRKYNAIKILRLPNLKHLNMSNNERKIMSHRYNKTVKAFYKSLNHWIDFYEKFRILYGKSKHGLAIMSGGGLDASQQLPEFSKSMLVAFARLDKHKMPKGTFFIHNKKLKMDSAWFKTQSTMKFLPKLFSEMHSILNELKEYGTYISRNHLLYVKNCGQDYLPYKDDLGTKEFGVFPGSKYSKKERMVIDRLIRDIVPNMNHDKKGIQYDLKSNHKRLNKSLKDNIVTNMYFG